LVITCQHIGSSPRVPGAWQCEGAKDSFETTTVVATLECNEGRKSTEREDIAADHEQDQQAAVQWTHKTINKYQESKKKMFASSTCSPKSKFWILQNRNKIPQRLQVKKNVFKF
jgi:ribosomal protein L33